MRILAVSDEEDPYLWSLSLQKHPKTDLILSCGDLDPDYLQYLVTVFNCPLVYVHGNHDAVYTHRPPEGCICAEDRICLIGDLRILGLGGCYRYKEGPHMYTEKEMRYRCLRLRRQIRRNKGFDILLTHAPAYGTGDLDDAAHRGFRVFETMIREHRPPYHIYGHVHRAYGGDPARIQRHHGGTTAVNASGKYWFDL